MTQDPETHLTQTTLGSELIRLLKLRGIDRFYANPGSEFASVIEGMSQSLEEGSQETVSQPVLVPHEFAAISCAHGSYLAERKPQAIFVHSSVGLANCLGAILNSANMRIPLVVISGGNPDSEEGQVGSRDRFFHWGQDQLGLSRSDVPAFKWSGEIRQPHSLESTLDRALAIANSDPKGPVLLSVSRETLLQGTQKMEFSALALIASTAESSAPPDSIQQVATKLLSSKRPLIITNALGKDPSHVSQLVSFCDLTGLPVLSHKPLYMNFPKNHRSYVGDSFLPWLEESDLVISLDTDVPWYPMNLKSRGDAFFVQVGPDPLYTNIPTRSFPSHISINSSSGNFLRQLSTLLEEDPSLSQLQERILSWLGSTRAKNQTIPTERTSGPEIESALSKSWSDDFAFFNEYKISMDRLPNIQPARYFRIGSASCLGWAPAAALGYSMSHRDQTVVCCIGDGSYAFANPHVIHWVSASYNCPVLFLLLNNGGYRSIESEVLQRYPNGAFSRSPNHSLTRMPVQPRYGSYAEAFDFPYECVRNETALAAAIEKGANHVRKFGQQYLIEIDGRLDEGPG